MNDPTITRVEVLDLRFPTSRESIGSDAVNKNPDYSAAYCILHTDSELKGYGLTFTLGRGNELCVGAARYLGGFVQGRRLSALTTICGLSPASSRTIASSAGWARRRA